MLCVPELPQSDSKRTRASYLLDGRRVTVRDLLDVGLLTAGEELTYLRPRAGESHRATVTSSGKLRLEDGREFPTPSGAAMAAAASGPVDGWWMWANASDTYLWSLRQQLLDQAAAEAPATSDAASTARWDVQRRYDWLNEARERAGQDNPVELLVRELFVRWGESSDGGAPVYQRIEADLANHGLTTAPNFRKVSLDTSVRIVIPVPDETGDQTTAASVEEDELDAGLTVGNIPSALGGVDSVPLDATFEQAITRMLLNGYSQLAVLSGPRDLRGAVTWQSIAYARHADSAARFRDAVRTDVRSVRYDHALIEVLPDIQAGGFVFVTDETNAVRGIVTTADVVGTFRELSTPFILFGELDQVLRQIISRTFTLEEIISVCNREGRREITSFDDLEMGDYQSILGNRDLWEKLGWSRLDRATLVQRLDELRSIRNNVMHFNPEPVPPNTVERLGNILKLLRDFGGASVP